MGHELSGTVEIAPAGSSLSQDQKVYIVPYLSCGKCVSCRRGVTNACQNISVLGVHRDFGGRAVLQDLLRNLGAGLMFLGSGVVSNS
jgi:threonine dehydrogenase-like Zn-dependent dehydrogenase